MAIEIPDFLPCTFRDAARKAIVAHPDNLQNAIEATRCAVKDELDSVMDRMIYEVIQQLVYDARHESNVKTRREAKQYGQPPKAQASQSQEVKNVYASLRTYFIGGTIIGRIKGADLESHISDEQSKSDGHLFNVRLLRRIQPLVPADKEVREVMKDKQFNAIFCEERDRKTDAA